MASGWVARSQGGDGFAAWCLQWVWLGFGCIRRFGILDCRAESGKCVLLWLVLWFGWVFASKMDEGLLDVSGHAEVGVSTFVVPV